MIQPVQYLLVGLPYSGKSTLASELKNSHNFAHINIDELKFARGYKDAGDDDVPDKVWAEIFDEADRLIVKYLNNGKNLANEYAWVTRAWRNRAKEVARKAGFDTKVIYIKLPLITIKERWEENKGTKQRYQWAENELENYLKDFEEPTAEEKVILYDQTLPFADWFTNTLNRQG